MLCGLFCSIGNSFGFPIEQKRRQGALRCAARGKENRDAIPLTREECAKRTLFATIVGRVLDRCGIALPPNDIVDDGRISRVIYFYL